MEFVIYGICKLKNEHFHFGDPKGRLPLKPCPVSLDAQFFSGSYGGMVAAAVCILDPQGHRFRTCVTGFREGARSGWGLNTQTPSRGFCWFKNTQLFSPETADRITDWRFGKNEWFRMAAILVDFDSLMSCHGGRYFVFCRVCSGNTSAKSPGTWLQQYWVSGGGGLAQTLEKSCEEYSEYLYITSDTWAKIKDIKVNWHFGHPWCVLFGPPDFLAQKNRHFLAGCKSITRRWQSLKVFNSEMAPWNKRFFDVSDHGRGLSVVYRALRLTRNTEFPVIRRVPAQRKMCWKFELWWTRGRKKVESKYEDKWTPHVKLH